MTFASSAAGLTVYRRLNPKITTDAFKAYITEREGGDPNLVNGELPRDYVWTDEIVEATTGFAVVGQNGDVLAEFPTLAAAENAKASAKVVFDVKLGAVDEDDD